MNRYAWTLAFSVSCAPAAAPVSATLPPAAASAAAIPATVAPASARPDDQTALDEKLGRALAYVAELRQLAPKSGVEGRLISRAEIERFILQQIEEEAPKDVIPATEALLFGFGTVDASFDYRKTLVQLMTTQLLGFYDPKRKTFFVSGDLSGEEADATLWHELVHALQDQHYDLSRLTDWQPDRGDTQAAAHALAEGDATSAMLDAVMKPRGGTALDLPDGVLRAESVLGAAALSAPGILVRSLIAPYADGLTFANHLRKRGGFGAVDAAWRALPVSTEQLLHPEKYFAAEAPLVVPLPSAPPHLPELKERFHDVMGEQGVRLLLEEWLPAGTAAAAASDWGGDRLAVFSDDARQRWAVGWHLRFDSGAAARRALEAWARTLPLTDRSLITTSAPAVPAKVSVKGDQLCRPRHTQGPIALVRRGPDLAVTVGPLERNGVAAEPDPNCAAALMWAKTIATN
ncbi:MAG TPA: hypothetical protein VJN18_17925 [Polyangiaceae bacterium]|nr:hypothetical protein [Polyangiaceae bacterium]